MPSHPSDNDEHTLRLALHAIIAPKRPPYSRTNSGSSSVSGTASPMSHPLPLHGAPAEYTGARKGSSRHSPAPNPHLESSPPSPLPAVHHASAVAVTSAAVSGSAGGDAGAVPKDGSQHVRVDLISTLQGKRAWDALIHGSWV